MKRKVERQPSGAHTPGPWMLFDKMGTLAVHREDGKPIVAWPGFDSADVGGYPVDRANARLIAAAPLLLQALEEARLFVADHGRSYPTVLARVDAALAAARPDVRRSKKLLSKEKK